MLKKIIPKGIILLLFVVFLNSCSTTQIKKNEEAFEPQVISSDVFYEENGKSFKLKSEIFVIGEKTVRVDLRTQLDLPLASLLMSDKKVEYVLYRDKKYFSGKPAPHVLDALIPMDLSSEDLVAVVLERPLRIQHCDYENNLLLRCRGQSGQTPYMVSWSKRTNSSPWSGKATKMIIELPARKISLKFYFTDRQKNPSNLTKVSTLVIPPDFHK